MPYFETITSVVVFFFLQKSVHQLPARGTAERIYPRVVDMIMFIDGQCFAKFPQLDLRVVETLMPFCPFLPAYA
ncbi:hypothetical protein T03_16042 [Trichinella britovi]|uniref:Uncharacterized protein n=1 Tax=Trichinella britovi TaxID=45882 RepID=A0A0V1CMV3_TRIBR|nr:hypothetical protein T03_16042 [Trichinella britovi]